MLNLKYSKILFLMLKCVMDLTDRETHDFTQNILA